MSPTKENDEGNLMKRVVRDFYEKTHQVNLLTGLALFFIIVANIAPVTISPLFVVLMKVGAIGLLGLAAFNTFTATRDVYKQVPDVYVNPVYGGLRTNVLMSYVLVVFQVVLVLYTLYTIF